MRPLSNTSHKALLPVGGTTILGRMVESLRALDVRDVTAVTGYRADEVENFLRSACPDAKLRFVHNPRYDETNNVVSLSLALEQTPLDDDVLLLECDLIFDRELLTRLIENPAKNVALVDSYRAGMDGTVVSVADGVITGVFPPHVQGSDFEYEDKFKTLNIYRFDREFCRDTLQPLLGWYAGNVDATSYYELVLGMLTNLPKHNIAAEVVDGDRWVEVDDPNDLAVGRFQFESSRRAEVLDRNLGGHWNFELTDFSFMRNAYFPTDAMFAEMRYALPALVKNYGSAQVVLNEKMSYFLECDPGRVQVLNGASQAFPILRDSLRTKRVAIPSPTFGEYSRMFPDATTYPDKPGVEMGRIDRATETCDVVVVVNPNTPTGTSIATKELYLVAREHSQTTFVVDESFIAFSDQPSIVGYLEEQPLTNVVVLTSLSKSLGIPGLRLGFLYTCDLDINAAVGASLPVWNLNAPAEFLLELLLKFRVDLQASLEQTAVDRENLRHDLGELDIVDHVHPSGGNYLLTCLVGSSAEVAHTIRQKLLAGFRIEVKDVSGRFPDGRPRLRLAVRTPDDNARLLDALRAAGAAA